MEELETVSILEQFQCFTLFFAHHIYFILALGTLYAFEKAAKLAKEKHNIDILAQLSRNEISIGLYHTAGKGTRLAPLPGSENNNKPGVKLPTTVNIGGVQSPITILEAVIKQTGCYAKSRLGRLSVFWGDQVFIPTVPVEYKVTHHVDILCSLGPMLTEADWKEKGMDKYGLIAQSRNGGAAQVEKVDHATAVQLLSKLGEIESVGVSLGSFSISAPILVALLHEFATELATKQGKFDSDPHLWMPMTLEKAAYAQLMQQKGISVDVSDAHFDRIANMMARFNRDHKDSPLGLFGPVDVGQGVYWWDYGQLKLYQQNTILLTGNSKEAALMRLFLGMSEQVRHSEVLNTEVDSGSCISSCSIGSDSGERGFIRNSVLSNVRCRYIEAEDCVLINVTADRIVAKSGSIVYNLIDSGASIDNTKEDSESSSSNSSGKAAGLSLAEREVMVGVFSADGSQAVVRSSLDTDGGKVWETRLPSNHASFEDIHAANKDVCPSSLETVIASAHHTHWNSSKQKKA